MRFKPGFTIIELLIYMGLLAVFLIILSSVFFSIIDTQLESIGSSDADLNSQFLLARISYDIHRASAVTVPTTLGQTTPTLTLTISGIPYTYALIGDALTLTVSGTTHVLNSQGSRVSEFSVTRLGNPSGTPSLQVAFDLQSTTVTLHQVAQTRSYQTTLNLR